MSSPNPHYLLFAEATDDGSVSRWRFVLQASDGTHSLEAEDAEPAVRGERLALLAVVRALESLDQPSRVTLACCPEYVRRGLLYGIDDWRRQGWRWEWFDRMVPVKNKDLWQRLDRAMAFHRVEAGGWRLDLPHGVPAGHAQWGTPHVAPRTATASSSVRPPIAVGSADPAALEGRWIAMASWYHGTALPSVKAQTSRVVRRLRRGAMLLWARVRRAVRETASGLAVRISQFCTPWMAPPWYR